MTYRTFALIFAALTVAFVVFAVQHLQAGESWVLSTLAAVVSAIATVRAASNARRDAEQADTDDESEVER